MILNPCTKPVQEDRLPLPVGRGGRIAHTMGVRFVWVPSSSPVDRSRPVVLALHGEELLRDYSRHAQTHQASRSAGPSPFWGHEGSRYAIKLRLPLHINRMLSRRLTLTG